MNQYPNYYGPPGGNPPQQFYAPPGNEQFYAPPNTAGNMNQNQNGYASGNADFLNKMSPMMSSLSGVGGEMLKSQTNTWASNFSVFWNSLKIYFAVTSGYVVNKLLTILYPFRNKNWIRLPADDSSAAQYQVRNLIIYYCIL